MAALVFVMLAFFAQTAWAICPDTATTLSSPVQYLDCVEVIDTNPGNPDTLAFNTSAATQIGDYNVIAVVRKSTTNASSITTPAGWTAILASTRNSNTTDGANDLVMAVFGKFATTAGGESVNITTSAGAATNDLIVWSMRFRYTGGYDTTGGASATSAPVAVDPFTSPSITPSWHNSLILRLGGIDDDDQTNTEALDVSPYTLISLQESAASNDSVTAIAAFNVQATGGVASGTGALPINGAEEWIARTIALRPAIGFSFAHAGTVQTCGVTAVTISALSGATGAVDTSYTGTVNLTTSTNNGYWLKTGTATDAEGTLTASGDDSGTATYQFVAADNGTATLLFYDTNVEAVNFNIVDTVRGYTEASSALDPSLTVSACTASSQPAADTCSANATFNLTIPASTTANRMVIVTWGGEDNNGNLAAATATYNGVAMQSIAFRRHDGATDVYSQIFALNSASLPAAAGSYAVTVTGRPAGARTCAFYAVGVGQAYPLQDSPPSNAFPVNGNTLNSATAISTQITTQAPGSFVVAAVSKSITGNGFTHNTLTEQDDTDFTGGRFSLSTGVVAAAGLQTYTDTSSTAAGILVQNVAAFAPVSYFSITHNDFGASCGASAITIRALTSAGTVDTTYRGIVNIAAQGTGDWSTPTANPELNNGTANDGLATYNFTAADNGQVTLYFTPQSGTTSVNFDVVDPSNPSRTVHPALDRTLTIENCFYRITHDTSGNTCSADTVTISVRTPNGGIPLGYTQSMNVSTPGTPTSDKGTWTLNTGAGSFNDPTAKDGQASYTFAASDNAQVTLNFFQAQAATVNFNVTGNGLLVSSVPAHDQNFVIGLCKFRVDYTGTDTTDVCSWKEVTISARDQNDNLVTGFTGQVALSTTTSHGSWRESGAQPGTLTDPVANDGAALFTFVAGDGGDVALEFNGPIQENLRVKVATLDNSMQVDTNPAWDPLLTINLCTFEIVQADGQLSTCTAETVTLRVRNSTGGIAVDYTGTVELTTNTGNGTWYSTTGLNPVQDPVQEDGAGSYTFADNDNGQVTFQLRNETSETFNVNVVDSLESDFRESGGFDANFEVTPCLPSISFENCYAAGSATNGAKSTTNALTLLSSAETDGSRMVLMYVASETNNGNVSAARIWTGATSYPMTLLRREFTASGVGSLLEVWGILDANLPANAGNYNAEYTVAAGPWDQVPAMCVVAVQGVKQELPDDGTSPTPASFNLNGTNGTGTTNASTGITTHDNNALLIGVLASGTNTATITTNLGTELWNEGGAAPGPVGARLTGHSMIQSVASAFTVTATGSANMNPYTHIALALAPIVAGNPYATDYVPVVLFDTLAGNLSYRAIGNSLRANDNNADASPPLSANQSACQMNTSSSSTLTLPAGTARIESAYLYWAGSGDTPDIDDTVNFGVLPSLVAITADDVFQILETGSSGNPVSFFLGYKDVTSLITTTTPQTFTLSGLTVRSEDGSDWFNNQSCMGGWSLVVVYENPTENPFVNVINLFHGFQPFQNNSFTLVPRNFRMAEPNVSTNVPRGQITHVTFEGDATLNTGTEVFELQNDPLTLTFEALTNQPYQTYNIGTAQYNDTVSMPLYDLAYNFTNYTALSTTSYGTDVDTYYISGPQAVNATDSKQDILYPFGVAKAEQITTRYSAGQDLVLLAGEFIEVTNSDLADLEMFVTTGGTFKVGTTGATLNFEVRNNGNNALGNGFATGEVVLTAVMPPGITISSVSAGTHWVCNSNSSALTCTFNIETWSGGATPAFSFVSGVWQLNEGYSLPNVGLTLSIGTEANFPLLNNNEEFAARIAHFDTAASCTGWPVTIGVQPDPTTCAKADQFDNVNDLNKNTIDIDNLDEKLPTNNNVDSASVIIRGIETDLSISKSAIGVLEQGDVGQYQLVITNNGPDATTKPMTVTDTFPAGVPPTDPGGAGLYDNWNCTVAGQALTCTRTVSLAAGASSTIIVDTGTITAAEGDFVSNTAIVAAGQYNFDNVAGNNADTEVSEIVGAIAGFNEKFLISVSEAATLGINAVSFQPEDLLLYDPVSDTAELFMDTSALGGLGGLAACPPTCPTLNTGIDAVHLLPNGWIVFSAAEAGSFQPPGNVSAVAFQDEDLILYDPILRTAQLIFDGSDANKFGAGGAGTADIDALHIDYNNSWAPVDWDVYISTTDNSSLPGVGAFQDNDVIKYDISAGTATLFFNGADANKFNGASGDIGGFFIRYNDAQKYVIGTDDASVTIDTDETFTRDDLVEYNNAAANSSKAAQVFAGDQYPSIFTPASGTRRIDAVHVVEEGYYGHFAISTDPGDICTAATVTITKHAGLTDNVQTNYQGSIRITASSGSGDFILDGSADGVLTNGTANDGVATYTFHANDMGQVVLALGMSTPMNNIDIDVTNGTVSERGVEDEFVNISGITEAVEYKDDFNPAAYNGSDGAGWSGSWIEVNDDSNAAAGSVSVVSGQLRITDGATPGQPALYRDIAFDYDANTQLAVTFDWTRSPTPADVFVVEYEYSATGTLTNSFTTLNTYAGGTSPGSGFANLTIPVTPVDGSKLRLRFRVTGGYLAAQFNIDNVKVATTTNSDCNPGVAVDHYHIGLSSSNLVSCLAATVTVTAHDTGHNAVAPGAGVALNLTTANTHGSWVNNIGPALVTSPVADNGIATYTFADGETAVAIPFNYTNPATDPTVVNINVVDSNLVTEAGGDHDPALSVARAGLRFFNENAGNATWPTMVAGMNSLAYTGQTLVVQAIRVSDNNPNVCVPLFDAGDVITLELAFECANPNTCANAGMQVAVTHDNGPNPAAVTNVNTLDDDGGTSIGNEAEFTPITLEFQNFTNGDTPTAGADYVGAALNINYADVGSLQIHGRYNIAFNNDSANAFGVSGNFMRGSSNLFVVRPFGLDVDFADDRRQFHPPTNDPRTSYAADHNGPAFAMAGQSLTPTVKAVAWQAADDANGDGVPDFGADLSDNLITANFGKETGFSAYRVQLSVITDNPNIVGTNDNPGVPGGIVGTLTQTGTFGSGFTAGVSNPCSPAACTVVFNEVGIFDVRAQLVDAGNAPINYLGTQNVVGGVAELGRFTPAYYDLNAGASFITERPNFPGVSTFTYLGEQFGATVAIEAKSVGGTTLQNYRGNFAKLSTLTSLNAGANTGQFIFKTFLDPAGAADTDLSARLVPANGSFSFSTPWTAGTATLTGRLVLQRQPGNAPDGPWPATKLAIDLLDSDNIADQPDVGLDNGTNEGTGYTWHYIDENEWRYGRLRIENAYGSDLIETWDHDNNVLTPEVARGRDVSMGVGIDYWNGAYFDTNMADNLTQVNISHVTLANDPDTGDLVDAADIFRNTGSDVNGGISTLAFGQLLETGSTDLPFFFRAPGAGQEGSLIMEYDLTASGLQFLGFDWRTTGQTFDDTPDGIYTDNPRAFLEFGSYRGNDRIINWQELLDR